MSIPVLAAGAAAAFALFSTLALAQAPARPDPADPSAEQGASGYRWHGGDVDRPSKRQPAPVPPAQDAPSRIGYSLGYQTGSELRRQGVDIDPEDVARGVRDALSGGEPAMSVEAMRATMAELQQEVAARRQTEQREQAQARAETGRAFLEANRTKPGVRVTDSGLQYKVIETGSGRSPEPTDTVRVHYRGTLVDGREFDSSYARGTPAEFRLDRVIKGWTEGLQLMKEGARYELYIPSELAYGDRGRLANQTLVFEVELLEVKPGS